MFAACGCEDDKDDKDSWLNDKTRYPRLNSF